MRLVALALALAAVAVLCLAAAATQTTDPASVPQRKKHDIRVNTDYSKWKGGSSSSSSSRSRASSTSSGAKADPLAPTLSRTPAALANPPVDNGPLAAGEIHGDWRMLSTRCFKKHTDSHVYSVCPMRNVTVYDNAADRVTLLGIWSQWHVADDGHLMMLFTDGCACNEGTTSTSSSSGSSGDAAVATASGPTAHVTKLLVSCRTTDPRSEASAGGSGADEDSDASYDDVLFADSAVSSFTEPTPCTHEATLALPAFSYICGGPPRPAKAHTRGSGSTRALEQLKMDHADAKKTASATASAAAGDSETSGDGGSGSGEAGGVLPSSKFENPPSTMERCLRQHRFLASEAETMQSCIDAFAAAAAAWADMAIPAFDPRTSEVLQQEMEVYERHRRATDSGPPLSPVAKVLSQLVRIPAKCVDFVTEGKVPAPLFFTPAQMEQARALG